jgi:hypothetical protein
VNAAYRTPPQSHDFVRCGVRMMSLYSLPSTRITPHEIDSIFRLIHLSNMKENKTPALNFCSENACFVVVDFSVCGEFGGDVTTHSRPVAVVLCGWISRATIALTTIVQACSIRLLETFYLIISISSSFLLLLLVCRAVEHVHTWLHKKSSRFCCLFRWCGGVVFTRLLLGCVLCDGGNPHMQRVCVENVFSTCSNLCGV